MGEGTERPQWKGNSGKGVGHILGGESKIWGQPEKVGYKVGRRDELAPDRG